MGRNGSVRRSYSVSPNDYKLLEEVGYGASATVYRANHLPTNEFVAVKRLDLDRCNSNLDDIRREAQIMSLIDHPNVIRAYCSFVVERYLWVVMPFMAGGSCLHLMKIRYPDGFEEPIICSILKETLRALEYLHQHGHIHRDVKAGNILLDSSGVVKLGDFGVSACLFDKGDRQRSRNTFVGTPCWMAPEVLQPGSGYDFKADIWSFGITALELAHGHAPFSKYPPMKVLLMTLQNAPPGLDYDRDKKFSKSFKEMIAMCLVKDQTKRPTAEKLLKHSFFKHAKPPEISLKSILIDLPPLWDRVKALQLDDAAQLALKKMPSSEQEALSQSEYQRGVSAWNFDIEDLKAQASLILDDDDLYEMKGEEESIKNFVASKDPLILRSSCEKSVINDKSSTRGSTHRAEFSETKCSNTRDEILQTDSSDASNQERLDRYDNCRVKGDSAPSTSNPDTLPNHKKIEIGKKRQTYSGPLVSSRMPATSVSERGHSLERFENDNQQGAERYIRDTCKVANLSGPLMLPNRASANSLSAPIRSSTGCGDLLEDKTKPNVVQIKGRFSVTSENVDLVKDLPLCNISRSTQESPLRKSASMDDWLTNQKPVSLGQPPNEDRNNNLKEVSSRAVPACILKPHLENIFQQASFQQDLIMNLLNSLQQSEIIDFPSQAQNVKNEKLLDGVNSERERILLSKISELQARMITLTDELTVAKLLHIQLQQELNALYNHEENKRNEEIEEC
ncbi:serine/threonine-protein kinase 26-like [Zingiber officinale]|uniref:serine/threonine-protein kinase 26-like n=1 Tax=Zingiber officinale TaxID=94328 RepID=UPI001C4B960B|nr:serine/threonine-protein kinase 26-like [Zingiber officinale]XP_042382492.1 serine/threonine-protein kinase 26-like [Zingiber officinale]